MDGHVFVDVLHHHLAILVDDVAVLVAGGLLDGVAVLIENLTMLDGRDDVLGAVRVEPCNRVAVGIALDEPTVLGGFERDGEVEVARSRQRRRACRHRWQPSE